MKSSGSLKSVFHEKLLMFGARRNVPCFCAWARERAQSFLCYTELEEMVRIHKLLKCPCHNGMLFLSSFVFFRVDDNEKDGAFSHQGYRWI